MTPKLHPSIAPLLLLGAISVLFGSSALVAAPNIIVILADDAGYADFGFQGGGINGDFADLTPNIDSIATGGVKFSNGYVAGPWSSPSRAGLLTGRHPLRFGVENDIQSEPNTGLPTTEKTIADTVKAVGYRTYAIGKWHLGQDLAAHHPNQRGFDEFFGFLGSERTYFQFTSTSNANKLQRNGTFITETAGQPYLTDIFGSEAAAYIDSHATNHPTQPFFMVLAFNGVHTPLEANATRLADPRIQDITNANRKTLAAMTIALDDAVGAVLAKLTQRGLTNDTLIVFASANGGPENVAGIAPNASDNGPLRGNKSLLYEGGIRVPFAIKWPAGIAPSLVGTTMADQVTTLDLLPTSVAAANGTLLPGQTTDGLSLLPRLNGTTTAPLQRAHFWRTGGSAGGQSAVRLGDWKLVRNDSTGAAELYNLATDLGETTNLAASNPAKVAELSGAHAQWAFEMVAPLWGTGSLTFSSTSLVRNPNTTGYELEKTGGGYAYAAAPLSAGLSLAEDWELQWTMESVEKSGYSRNGGLVLGDSTDPARYIRIGLGFVSGAASITELQNGATSSATWSGTPAGDIREYRLQYTAATRTLTFRDGTRTVSLALTGSYAGDVLNVAGYTLFGSTLTRFSSVTRHIAPRAPATTPTWARMKVAKDYFPGTYDTNGNWLGGTELIAIVPHAGKLFAINGYWNDVSFGAGSPDPYPGPQILVKDAWDAPWRQEIAPAATTSLRFEVLRAITFTTDKNGAPLNPPVTKLLAAAGQYGPFPREFVVWVRNDAPNPTWTKTVITTSTSGSPRTRVFLDHVDEITGIHHVFTCSSLFDEDSRIYRGGYNATTGLIDWDPIPELEGSERILSGGNLNGWLYACVGSDGDPTNNVGGVFWRRDGAVPEWEFVYEWPLGGPLTAPDVRGFTVVPHPKGFDYDVALVTLESFGKLYMIDPIGGDPRNGHIVTEELDFRSFLGDEWNQGARITGSCLTAYNNMPEVIHPGTGQPVNLIGLGVEHPAGRGTPMTSSSFYVVRHRDARFEWGRIFDPAFPLPNPVGDGLRSARAVCVSPFPEDRGRVVFFGGFDAGGGDPNLFHNTAWLYRAELPDETPQIQRTGVNVTLPIDTAHGWQYQLRYSPDLSQWFDLGSALNGNNAPQSQLVTPAPGTQRQFYRWQIKRP